MRRLSNYERQISRLTLIGFSQVKIAKELKRSRNSVHLAFGRLYNEIGASNSLEFAVMALNNADFLEEIYRK
jgi:DNA-binding CsgD family transcriptional regulator